MDIKLKNIHFDANTGFRKLKNITINIGNKLTLIAGHNGLGKSTILALIANASGQPKSKSILDKELQADFSEIFHIDYQKDFSVYEENKLQTPYAILSYEIKSTQNSHFLLKKCQIEGGQKELSNQKLKPFHKKVEEKDLTAKQLSNLVVERQKSPNAIYHYRPRVIPRTHTDPHTLSIDKERILTSTQANELYQIGASAKVSLPTIYVGMSRMTPIGEFNSFDVSRDERNKLPKNVLDFYNLCYKKIFHSHKIDLLSPTEEMHNDISAYEMKFKGSRKSNLISNIEETILNISLGQDSVSTVITALTSFYNLKQNSKEGHIYNGGILVIDEIDAGLHPRAQEKLIHLLYEQAKTLNLQIIFTTHSLTVIQTVFYLDKDNAEPYKQNAINYLQDTQYPKLLSQPSYLQIKNDMLLSLKSYQSEKTTENNKAEEYIPTLKVYFEDQEALDFFSALLNASDTNNTLNCLGAKLILIPAKLGCFNLLALIKADTDFQKALIVLDDDVEIKSDGDSDHFSAKNHLSAYKNVVKLPGAIQFDGKKKENMPPDQLIYYYLLDKYNTDDASFWHDHSLTLTTDYAYDRLLNFADLLQIVREIPKENRKNQEAPRKQFKTWYNTNRTCLQNEKLFEKWAKENQALLSDFIGRLKAKVELLVALQSKIGN